MSQAIKLRKVLEKITDLPTLPTVVSRILQYVSDPTSSAKGLSELISHDQSLTVKVLRVVNSAFYGFPKKISSLHQATAILGYNAIKNMALSVAVFGAFGKDGDSPDFDREGFWRHSIAVGVIARLMARKIRFHEVEEAFIAGLIHDVGKVLLDQYLHDDFIQCVRLAREKNLLILSAERAHFGFDHCDVGGFLAKRWNLSETLSEVLTYHNSPPGDLTTLGGNVKLVALVHVSDIMARGAKIGFSGDDLVPRTSLELWKELGLTREAVVEVKDRISDEMDKADEFMKISRE